MALLSETGAGPRESPPGADHSMAALESPERKPGSRSGAAPPRPARSQSNQIIAKESAQKTALAKTRTKGKRMKSAYPIAASVLLVALAGCSQNDQTGSAGQSSSPGTGQEASVPPKAAAAPAAPPVSPPPSPAPAPAPSENAAKPPGNAPGLPTVQPGSLDTNKPPASGPTNSGAGDKP